MSEICPRCRTSSTKVIEGSIWMYKWCEKCQNVFAVNMKQKPIRRLEAETPSLEMIRQKKFITKK
ncbi:hypothetical protein ES703_98916 [subsurface metagenome]